jgi:hypothetical protein
MKNAVIWLGVLALGVWWWTRDSGTGDLGTGYASGFDPTGHDTTSRGSYTQTGTWEWNPLHTGPRGR